MKAAKRPNSWVSGLTPSAVAEVKAPDPGDTRRFLDAVATLPAHEWPRAVVERLQRAAAAYLEASAKKSMDECLGLKPPPSRRKDLTMALQSERDAWLVEAAADLNGATSYLRAGELAAEIAKFEDMYWPDWQERDEPPHDATRLRAALFRAFKVAKVPHGIDQLRTILERAPELGLARNLHQVPSDDVA